jgi:hypothetical protein
MVLQPRRMHPLSLLWNPQIQHGGTLFESYTGHCRNWLGDSTFICSVRRWTSRENPGTGHDSLSNPLLFTAHYHTPSPLQLIIYINSMEVSPWEATVNQTFKKFPAFCGTWRLLFSARWIHSMHPKHTSIWSILILTSHLTYTFSYQNSVSTPTLSRACFMPCPHHPPWLDHSNSIWQEVQLRSSSICNLLQPPITSFS